MLVLSNLAIKFLCLLLVQLINKTSAELNHQLLSRQVSIDQENIDYDDDDGDDDEMVINNDGI